MHHAGSKLILHRGITLFILPCSKGRSRSRLTMGGNGGKYVSLLTDTFMMAVRSGCQCDWTAPLLVLFQSHGAARFLFSHHFPPTFPQYRANIALSLLLIYLVPTAYHGSRQGKAWHPLAHDRRRSSRNRSQTPPAIVPQHLVPLNKLGP